MAIVQSSYSDVIAAGTPGLVANGELANRISRTLSGANLAFGLPVLRGASDHNCILAVQETYEAVGAAVAGNTGNGTMGSVTVSAGAKLGIYKLTIVEPATNAGAFVVEDPDGAVIGNGDVAAAFSSGGLAFTLADGSTDFAAGDQFNITVTATSGSDIGDFLGVSIRDTTLGAEQNIYEAGDTVAILDEGVVWVTAGASVTPADKPHWNPATGRYTKTTSHFAVPGATFESSAANGELVKLKLRKLAPR